MSQEMINIHEDTCIRTVWRFSKVPSLLPRLLSCICEATEQEEDEMLHNFQTMKMDMGQKATAPHHHNPSGLLSEVTSEPLSRNPKRISSSTHIFSGFILHDGRECDVVLGLISFGTRASGDANADPGISLRVY